MGNKTNKVAKNSALRLNQIIKDIIIVDEYVEVTWNGTNIQYYKSLGYEYTGWHTKFLCHTKDLLPNGSYRVTVSCPLCGKDRSVAYSALHRVGHSMCKSCAQTKWLVGMKFGRLLVVDIDREKTRNNPGTHWQCECECGNVSSPSINALTSGNTISCGCYHRELVQNRSGSDLHNWAGGPAILSCEECGVEYSSPQSRKDQSRFCSRRCHGKWQSRNNVRDRSPSWNPNKTNKDREKERLIPGYKEWRIAVYERDNYTCQACCSKNKGRLNAHHLYDYSTNPEQRISVENGITMHESCHIDFHKWMGGKQVPCTPADFYDWMNSK